jgi:hypothetical protein
MSVFTFTFFFVVILNSVIHSSSILIPTPPEREGFDRQRNLCIVEMNSSSIQCSNWAGTKTWKPSEIFLPKDEEELASFLESTSPQSRFKIVGYGHSWAGLYIPPPIKDKVGITIALHHLSGITGFFHSSNRSMCLAHLDSVNEVEVMTGTSFAVLHKELDNLGLGLAWQSGGIQGLTVGGAMSVGYHGSQMSIGSVSSVIHSLTVFDTHGKQYFLEYDDQNQLMLSARLGLGVCGVITRATLPVIPQFYLRRRRWNEFDIPLFLSRDLTRLKTTYDRFHYYIHPYSNSIWPMFWEQVTKQEYINEAIPCRTAQEQWEDQLELDYGMDGLPLIMRWDNCSDVGYKAYTHAIDMEAQPLWNGEWFVNMTDEEEGNTVLAIINIFQEIAQTYKKDHKPDIDLWLHIRYTRGDKNYLNPCYGWDICAGFELALVAKGMDEPLPSSEKWYRYFHPFENYLKSKGARPHWAKDHTPDPDYMAKSGLPISYFLEQCKILNPDGIQGHHEELKVITTSLWQINIVWLGLLLLTLIPAFCLEI